MPTALDPLSRLMAADNSVNVAGRSSRAEAHTRYGRGPVGSHMVPSRAADAASAAMRGPTVAKCSLKASARFSRSSGRAPSPLVGRRLKFFMRFQNSRRSDTRFSQINERHARVSTLLTLFRHWVYTRRESEVRWRSQTSRASSRSFMAAATC